MGLSLSYTNTSYAMLSPDKKVMGIIERVRAIPITQIEYVL